jgi:hypothetical protein
MSSQPIQYYEDREDALSGVKGELLEVLLHSEDNCYPWNPMEPEAEDYFAELERGYLLPDWQEDEEMKSASQGFFNQLHECWTSLSLSASETLMGSLAHRFSALMPQSWLEAIANKAQQVVSTNLSLADQLVLCVKPLLPSWTEEDLLVLARPLAYAMRGNSEPVPSADWEELSQMEQVRLSLRVAHSTLAQLNDATENLEQS